MTAKSLSSSTKVAQDPMVLLSDPLSEALETFRLQIRLAGRVELAAPWGLSVPDGVGAIYAVTRGDCWLTEWLS